MNRTATGEPYTIKVLRSAGDVEDDAMRLERAGHAGEAFALRHSGQAVSVEAVEDLRAARDRAFWIVAGLASTAGPWAECLAETKEIGSEGGSVDLPDGRRVVVEKTTYDELLEQAIGKDFAEGTRRVSRTLPEPVRDRKAIDVFNAAMAERYGREGEAETYRRGTALICAKHNRWVAYDDGRKRDCPECPPAGREGER